MLRLSVLVNDCTPYSVKPSVSCSTKCNQFLGPTQPGVTTPDPTERERGGGDQRRPAGGSAPAANSAPAWRAPASAPAPQQAPPLSRAERSALDFLLGAMRRAGRQLGASPVLIGAVTLLIAIVAVFISYSANNGLPFVPTYKLKAELPNGAKLVKGNEVRAGGFRVGIVEEIKSARRTVNGEERAIAVLDLSLDKQIEPLSVDTTLSVRPRSALGLKYVELIPGRSQRTYQDGDTMPLSRRGPERARARGRALDVRAADARRRAHARSRASATRSPAAGPPSTPRSASSSPFTRYLLPVMRNLSDRNTELRNFFPALGAAAAEAAPVAQVQARWFGEMATTFAAIGRDPQALRETIEESPPTLEAATESFRVQTPVPRALRRPVARPPAGGGAAADARCR